MCGNNFREILFEAVPYKSNFCPSCDHSLYILLLCCIFSQFTINQPLRNSVSNLSKLEWPRWSIPYFSFLTHLCLRFRTMHGWRCGDIRPFTGGSEAFKAVPPHKECWKWRGCKWIVSVCGFVSCSETTGPEQFPPSWDSHKRLRQECPFPFGGHVCFASEQARPTLG